MTRMVLLVGALTRMLVPERPATSAHVVVVYGPRKQPSPALEVWPDLVPPSLAALDAPKRQKKCEKCHKWTGGADHYCKRGRR